jgi:hypothetical protein
VVEASSEVNRRGTGNRKTKPLSKNDIPKTIERYLARSSEKAPVRKL